MKTCVYRNFLSHDLSSNLCVSVLKLGKIVLLYKTQIYILKKKEKLLLAQPDIYNLKIIVTLHYT